ncbi:MAG: PAS domain S-box protein [Candidatus Lokiarchaeota archaeon]|nr:PAS domain S-box protein [Candidatus Lokiarchaeota archaeon]MBD3338805.1 PAS domain S-box protein [Candidatus Lokiarchaeota archaeon]
MSLMKHRKEHDLTFKDFAKAKINYLEKKLSKRKNLLRITHNKLKERIKELTCLYQISKIIENQKYDTDLLIYEVLKIIPSAFQFPDLVQVCVNYKFKIYHNKDFRKTIYLISSQAIINNEEFKLTVYYTSEEEFLIQEKKFLKEVVEKLKLGIEQRQLLTFLSESERKFKELTENSLLGIAIIQDGKFVYTNDMLSQINNFSREEMYKWKKNEVFDHIHPDDKEKLKKLFKDVQDKEINYTDFVFRAYPKFGELHYLRAFARYVTYNHSPALQVELLDETAHVKAQNLLIESERKLAYLFKNTLEGILVIGSEGKVIEANDSAINLLGYQSRKEFIGIEATKLHPKPGDREKIIEITRNNSCMLNDYEMEVKRKDGKIITTLVNSKMYLNEDDSINHIEIFFNDITKIKKYQKKLEDLIHIKSGFLKRVSHDLKTPLTAIDGFANFFLMDNEDSLSEERLIPIKNIISGAQKLKIIIAKLLKGAALEDISYTLKKQRHNLSELIQFILSELSALIQRKKHQIIENIDKNLVLEFDEDELSDAITNLISNSIKFTPSRGKIKISSKKSKNFVIISVQDNGVGFTEEEKSEAFKQFGKINHHLPTGEDNIEGTGLGLYITKKIIEMHGGEVWLESEGRNKGTTIIFTLPL